MNTALLRERVVVVTGAGAGIGAETARLLAAAGARLVLADHEARTLNAVQDELGRRTSTLAVTTDVRSADAVRRLAASARAAWGHVDAVVHCAAVVHPGPFVGMSDAALRCQVDTNIWGTLHVARAFVPVFLRQRDGHLVLFGSLGGMIPMALEAAYCMTKYAVRGLAFSLALELKDAGIAVSVVSPDSTRTAQLDAEAHADGDPLSFASAPLEPSAVARAVLRALLSRRIEITVPGPRGACVRLLGAFPGACARILPLLARAGRDRRERYRAALGGAAAPGRCHEASP